MGKLVHHPLMDPCLKGILLVSNTASGNPKEWWPRPLPTPIFKRGFGELKLIGDLRCGEELHAHLPGRIA